MATMNHSKIEKGGEGSRGGEVVGRTKSGKPVYAGHSPISHPDKFTGHSPADHSDAANAHREAQATHRKEALKHMNATMDAQDRGDHAAERHHSELQRRAQAHMEHHGNMARQHQRFADGAKGYVKKAVPVFAVSPSSSMVSKGGEGSKGGKIIGHTRSGKPVYATRGAGHSSYKNFDPYDHDDAVDLHLTEAGKHSDAYNQAHRNAQASKMKHHQTKEDRHLNNADQHAEKGTRF